jgi:DNA (cytosine-5)-methyltransferase 1
MDPHLTFLDLFCGCGGFSLGMKRAGFRCLAAIDLNPEAVETFRANFPRVKHALEADLTKLSPEQLASLVGTEHVDVIVGGPPCQGFSTARQVDGANHGTRLKDDPRRHLFREFLRYVDFFQPRVFVMENVLGIRTAAGGEFFTQVQHEARSLGHTRGLGGYRVHPQTEDAWELGVPQKRRRQLIIGVRNDVPGYFPPDLRPAERARPHTTLGDAIGDLPPVAAGGGEEVCDYDKELRQQHLRESGTRARNFLHRVLEVSGAKNLTAHRARPHSDRDLGDFRKLREGENSAQAMRRGVVFDFPYDKTSFKDRYTRQSRREPCSTIVAHLSKDGLMFIHPRQLRSLTPREAARVQSFPDWFAFPVARTHQFRLIGNAVPPLIAEAVGDAVKAFLRQKRSVTARPLQIELPLEPRTPRTPRRDLDLPCDMQEASERLRVLARCTRRELRALGATTFRRGWHALLYSFPELHPDNALDHGATRFQGALLMADASDWRERYARSGWPVALVLIGEEAWRRHQAGELSKRQLYCASAQKAGLIVRQQARAFATQPVRTA